MPEGAGKYDDLCVDVLTKTNAECVVVMVVNGNRGNGFSVNSVNHKIVFEIPEMLEHMAEQIRDCLPKAKLN